MFAPDVHPGKIVHDDTAEHLVAEAHLMHDLYHLGQMIGAACWCACCGYEHPPDDDCPNSVPRDPPSSYAVECPWCADEGCNLDCID